MVEEKKDTPEKTPESATPEAVAGGGKKRPKKIRRMSQSEVEKALAHARTTMAGDASQYVRHLLARQAELEAKKQ